MDVRPSTYDAGRLFEYVRGHLLDLMPSIVNPAPEHANPCHIYEGATLTMALPLRGHIQVRVTEAADGKITLMTIAGHPLAGAVRFVTLPIEGGVHFEVQVFDRPASLFDWALMRPDVASRPGACQAAGPVSATRTSVALPSRTFQLQTAPRRTRSPPTLPST